LNYELQDFKSKIISKLLKVPALGIPSAKAQDKFRGNPFFIFEKKIAAKSRQFFFQELEHPNE